MEVWAEWIATDAAESSVEDQSRLLMAYFQNLNPEWQDESAKPSAAIERSALTGSVYREDIFTRLG
jgi:hypothetical protein